jgi:hypothetical protein
MDILILQVFVSLGLVAGSVLLYAFTCRQRDFEHADRLALLPMNDDAGTSPPRAETAPVTRKEP